MLLLAEVAATFNIFQPVGHVFSSIAGNFAAATAACTANDAATRMTPSVRLINTWRSLMSEPVPGLACGSYLSRSSRIMTNITLSRLHSPRRFVIITFYSHFRRT